MATGQTFTSVITELDVSFQWIVAVADINGDGRDDLVAMHQHLNNVGDEAEERLIKTPLYFLFGERDGTFTIDPGFVDGAVEARTPVVVVDDFNNDSKPDVVVFDGGIYSERESIGLGNPPQLLLSSPDDDLLHHSGALADAVRREHEREIPPEGLPPDMEDLHVKTATSGDIDGDGDVDLWIHSGGGLNVEEHFMVNNGNGTFTIELERIPLSVLTNYPRNYWGYNAGHLADIDNDSDLDLVLGQMRDLTQQAYNNHSVVMLNDGTGHYPSRIDLDWPDFFYGFTAVEGITEFDVNDDGFQDLILVHQRNNDVDEYVAGFTGRYVQVLINDGGTGFVDESDTRVGDQSATLGEFTADGVNPLHNAGRPEMHDVDVDGCPDLVMAYSPALSISTESPLAYRNDGNGQFAAYLPDPFTAAARFVDPFDGSESLLNARNFADVNGDGAIDLVADPISYNFGAADDYTTVLTVLNTTSTPSIRCGPGP